MSTVYISQVFPGKMSSVCFSFHEHNCLYEHSSVSFGSWYNLYIQPRIGLS